MLPPLLLRVLFLLTAPLLSAQTVVPVHVLRTAREVRELNAAEAAEGRAAELEANVVFVESPGTVFVQDDSGSTFLRTKSQLPALMPGDLVRATGTTFPGLYLPGVEIETLEVIGPGTLQTPPQVVYDDLMSARYHYAEVQLQGVGRSIEPLGETKSVLKLGTGRQVLEVRVDAPLTEAPQGLVDAEVKVRGLAAGGINDRRQLVFPYLRLRDWSQITVLSPAPAINTLPLSTADQLMSFGSAMTSARRVRLNGTVLAVFPPSRVHVRSEVPAKEDAIRSSLAFAVYPTHALDGILPGQSVQITGFPFMDRYSAALGDSQVTQIGDPLETLPPEPLDIDLTALKSGVHDADLVRLAGTLEATFRTANHTELVLRTDKGEFRALLPQTLDTPEQGSTLKVSGICEVDGTVSDRGFRSLPASVRVLLRTVDDLHIVQSPPWWTAERLLLALGSTVVLLVLSAAWIALLQRQVLRQTATIRDRIAHEAMLEERQRIAREVHDTLEQELAGLSLRLDAASTRPLEEKAKALLTTSRHLVSRIQSEARNLVADLRADVDGATSLGAALSELAARTSFGQTSVEALVDDAMPELPGHLAHHLRMIAQEAVTNGLKHAQARHIQIHLFHDGKVLMLEVRDDGVGLSHLSDTQGRAGHFGCMGIRERCRSIGADVQWTAGDGCGTCVRVSLPLPA